MNAILVLSIVYLFSLAIPVVLGFKALSSLKTDMKMFLLLCLLAGLVEGMSFYRAFHHTDGQALHNLYLLTEFTLITLIFSRWQNRTLMKSLFLISLPVLLVIYAIDMFGFHGLSTLSNLSVSISYIAYVFISLFTLLTLQRLDTGSIHEDYRFWISSGLLLYSAGSLGYFIFYSQGVQNYLIALWYFQMGLNIAASVFYGIGFICTARY